MSNYYSEQERIEAYKNPNPHMISDSFIDENKDNVLKLLALKGTMYTTEISKETNYHLDTINKILQFLIQKKYIKKTTPDRWQPSPVHNARIQYFQSQGWVGFGNWSRRSWYMPTKEGIEYLKNKYKGTGLQVKGSLIKELGMLYNNRSIR